MRATVRIAVAVVALVPGYAQHAGAEPFLEPIETHRAESRRLTHGMVVSPDGAHAYVAVDGGDTVAVFERDGVSGGLTFIDNDEDPGDGIVDVFQGHVAISPDGAHLYVADADGDGVSALARDGVTGLLDLVEFETDGVGGVTGLVFPRDLAVSPDGDHVYVTGGVSNALVVFARDTVTGALAFVEAQVQGVGGVDGLADPTSVAVSEDGGHVYVASIGNGFSSRGVAVFARNPVTGELTFVQALSAADTGGALLTDSFDVEVAPGGAHVYVLSDVRLFRFARDAGTGVLSFVSVQSGATRVAIELNAAGDRLYALQTSAHVEVRARDTVTGALTFVETIASVNRSGDDLAGDPTGVTEVYVTADDTIVPVLDAGGSFEPGAHVRAGGGVVGLWDAASVIVSPDGAHVYACGTRDDAIAVFERDPGTGSLTSLGAVKQGLGGASGLDGVRHLSISPDGATIYASALDATFTSTLSAYARNAGTGALTFVETEPNTGRSVVSPDGSHVYSSTGVYERDAGTGALTFVAAPPPPHSYFPLAFSADGLHAYGGGSVLRAYARNPISGLLTEIDTEEPGLGSVPEDFSVGDLVLSADGSRLFVSNRVDFVTGGLFVFDRDGTTGTLTFRQQALDAPLDAIVEVPGGAMLVAAADAFFRDDVLAFGLNPLKATVSLLQTVSDLEGPEELQPGPALAVSADGTTLYATSPDAEALAVFRVNDCVPAVTSTKVVLKQIAPEPTPGNDALVLKTVASLGGVPFAALDLDATGARVVVERADGSTAADVAIPSGTFGGAGTAGWRLNAIGTVWTYLDKTPTPPNGIKKIVVKDHGVKVPGFVKLKVASSALGSYPVTPADLPVAVTIELGAPVPCARTGFGTGACLSRPTGTAVCKTK